MQRLASASFGGRISTSSSLRIPTFILRARSASLPQKTTTIVPLAIVHGFHSNASPRNPRLDHQKLKAHLENVEFKGFPPIPPIVNVDRPVDAISQSSDEIPTMLKNKSISKAARIEEAASVTVKEEPDTRPPLNSGKIIQKITSKPDAKFEPPSWHAQQNLSKDTKAAIERYYDFKTLTSVQESVVSLLPTSQDLLVKAKTGTGKTLAFLVGAIENVLGTHGGFKKDAVSILVISPTRELAAQILVDAEKLGRAHGLTARLVVGGEARSRQVRSFDRRVDIVVATPGRLLDILGEANVRAKFQHLKVVVLDEADQILDMGFSADLERIRSLLPRRHQTFLFSATLAENIKRLAADFLQPGYKYINTVPSNDVATQLKTKQSYVVAPYSLHLITLLKAIEDHTSKVPHPKIIVFFNTTKLVAHAASIFNQLENTDIMQIHSGLDQSRRARISERFRKARK
ncbi:hypothetical protein HDV05_001408, partial [Chytridiales sp. JEL 0842]